MVEGVGDGDGAGWAVVAVVGGESVGGRVGTGKEVAGVEACACTTWASC